jgi:bacillolysin
VGATPPRRPGGAIADRYSDLQTQAAVVGSGRGVWGDEKKVSAEAQPGGFRARDHLRPPLLVTYDLREDASAGQLALTSGVLGASYVALDSDNDWTDGAVVDAHVYAGLTYDYYYLRHGRRGLDDADVAIASVTHLFPRSLQYANAFWDPAVGAMFYGDGDAQFGPFSGALDVVAHELSHGVTSYTWNGIYQGESGALN